MSLYEPPDFHFNGRLMPRWGCCWSLAGISGFLKDRDDWDQDFGHRDLWIIEYRIDHVGTVESADPRLFVYVVQEVLLLLLRHSAKILENLTDREADPSLVHRNLVEAAFEMRRLTLEDGCAFWSSGGEEDRLRCVEWMEQSRLPEGDPRHRKPPHVLSEESSLAGLKQRQSKELHRIAQEGRFDREMRKKLLGI
jgi:hypothetical protein